MTLALWLLAACAATGEWAELSVVATAYCPCRICCGVRGVGITADGTDTRTEPYGIATGSTTALAFGTVVWIPPGHGYLDRSRASDDGRQFIVDDTGGALRTNTKRTGILHIDLRFKYHGSAQRFGRKLITIYVWKE
jgi:3D (Asp-Asp-Asp) domain-containing protein